MLGFNFIYKHLLILLILAFFSYGCSSKDTQEIAEIPTTKAPISDVPQIELFAKAKKLYRSGLYMVARDSFESLRDAYPLGPYTEFAEIKIADCNFELDEYDTSAALYEELLKSRPASNAVPYLLLQSARSFHLVNEGVGRDISPLQKALDYYNELIEKHPNSIYVKGAKMLRRQLVQQISKHERMVIEFYKKKQNIAASSSREQEFEEKWAAYLAEDSEEEQIKEEEQEADETNNISPAPKILDAKRSANS